MLSKADRLDFLEMVQRKLYKLSSQKSQNLTDPKVYRALKHKHDSLQAMEWRVTTRQETEADERKVKEMLK